MRDVKDAHRVIHVAWGPDGALRARRETEASKPKEGLLSSWVTEQHKLTVKLSNLGPEPREVRVTERLPVSDVEQVQIEPDAAGTTGGVVPDKDGFVRWPVVLPPFGQHVLKLAYTMRRHKDVMQA